MNDSLDKSDRDTTCDLDTTFAADDGIGLTSDHEPAPADSAAPGDVTIRIGSKAYSAAALTKKFLAYKALKNAVSRGQGGTETQRTALAAAHAELGPLRAPFLYYLAVSPRVSDAVWIDLLAPRWRYR